MSESVEVKKRQKELIKYILAIIILVLLCAFCVGLYFIDDVSVKAESVSELKLTVGCNDLNVSIDLWTDPEGILYGFIPESVASGGRVVFSNIAPDSSLCLHDGYSVINVSDNTALEIKYDQEYGISYTNSKGVLSSSKIIFKELGPNPIVFISTDSGGLELISSEKGLEEKGDIEVFDTQGKNCYSGALKSVRIRGNTSFFMPKKSFSITLSSSARLLDLNKSDKWVLLAKYDDQTKIRDSLVNAYVDEFTCLKYIELKYCDVFVNGEYNGLYLLGNQKTAEYLGIFDLKYYNDLINDGKELIQYVSPDNSIHAFDGFTPPDDISGGYLLEVINDYEYETSFPAFQSVSGNYFCIQAPNNATIEEVEYIKAFVDEMELAIYSEDGMNPNTAKHYSSYLDVDDWVDYYLVKEGMGDLDVYYRLSMYMFKDSDSVGDGLVHMGPVWDMDKICGKSYIYQTAFLCDPEMLPYNMLYSEKLLSDEDVISLIGKKLQTDLEVWVNTEMNSEIEDLYSDMGESYYADLIRWPDSVTYDYCYSVEGNILMMNDYLRRRISCLSSVFCNCDNWCDVHILDSDGNLLSQYRVRSGSEIKKLPIPKIYVGFFAGWKLSPDSNYDLEENVVTGDVTLIAQWIPVEFVLESNIFEIKRIIDDTDIVMLDVGEIEGFILKIESMKMK